MAVKVMKNPLIIHGTLASKHRILPVNRHDHNKALDEIQKGIIIEW